MASSSKQTVMHFMGAKSKPKTPNVQQRVKNHLDKKSVTRKDSLLTSMINFPKAAPKVTPSEETTTTHQKLDKILAMLEKNDQRVDNVEAQLERHDENFCDVDNRLNELEQAKCNAKMEVSGLDVPLRLDRAGVKSFFCEFLHSINIAVNEMEVADTFVVTRRTRNVEKKVLIVTFLHEAIKNRIMSSKIQHDRNSQETSVFFGHVLTRPNHKLFMVARQAKRDGKLSRVWVFNGNVFVKKLNDDNRVKLINLDHLSYLTSNSPADTETAEEIQIDSQQSSPSMIQQTPTYSAAVKLNNTPSIPE